jgi:hypothetical protein
LDAWSHLAAKSRPNLPGTPAFFQHLFAARARARGVVHRLQAAGQLNAARGRTALKQQT